MTADAPRRQLASLLMLMLMLVPSVTQAATYVCPTGPGPFPQPPVELERWRDKKGGTWTLTCTNQSASGDFVWTYQANAGAVKKTIGRCVYVGGRNRTWESRGSDGNIKIWKHICVNPQPVNGEFCAILDVFDKEACRSTRRYLKYRTGRWVEDMSRRETTTGMYDNFNPADLNGDGVPDENFAWLTSDQYPTPPPPLPAEFESRTTLHASFNGSANEIAWDVGEVHPVLSAGDNVLLSDVTSAMLLSSDPRFTVSDSGEGLVLTANASVAPVTGELLAVLADTGGDPLTVRWSVEDVGAADYWLSAFDDPRPLEEVGFSSALDFADMPGYASSMGNLTLVPEPGAVTLLWLTGLPLLTRRR